MALNTLLVGGFAVIYHAQPRFTKDMDLFVKADPENAQAIYAALASFGAPLQGIRPEDFTDRNKFIFDLAASRRASIFSRPSRASILTRHGKGALKRRSTPRPARRHSSFPPTIS
ncbi:MAG TPA: hypothetical protein VKV15_17925 [Bryobacteraceae bacterium]|nr:hypothetical protein [Bryobacteraceae bacterium]